MVQMIGREPQESFSTPFVAPLFDLWLVWVIEFAGVPKKLIFAQGVQDYRTRPVGPRGGEI